MMRLTRASSSTCISTTASSVLPRSASIQPLGDQPDHDVVGHERAPFHDVAGLAAKLGPGRHGRPQHVSGGKLDERTVGLQQIGLGPLAGTGRTKQDQDHCRRAPLSLARLISPSYWWAKRWLCTWATVSMVTLTTMRSEVPPK